MPFPRIAEIIDLVAQFVVYQACEDHMDYIIQNIRNFRLVCKDFAAAGLRYLVPTLVLMRVPESFDFAMTIANHPVLRLGVERLVFYHNTFMVRRYQRGPHPNSIAIAAARMEHSLISGEDLQQTEHLIRMLPNLSHVEIRSLSTDMMLYHRPEPTALSSKFISEYDFYEFDSSALEFLSSVKRMRVLVVSGIPWTLPSSVDTRYLRKLSVTSPREYFTTSSQISSTTTMVLDNLPLLEELQYCGPRSFVPFSGQPERLVALPPTLRTLSLRQVEFSGESFPTHIHTLELSDVVLETEKLPDELWSISFADVTWHSSSLDKWAEILLSLKPGCKFDVTGGFLTYSKTHDRDNNKNYLHCKCIQSGTTSVGWILANILQLQTGNAFKEELLRRLFEKCNRPGLIFQGNLHRAASVRFDMPKCFYADYTEVMEQYCNVPEVLARDYDCAACNARHGVAWSGVIG